MSLIVYENEKEKDFIKILERGRLTEHQLVFINSLLEGEWRDRNELLKIPGMKGANASTIAQRIIKPFQSLGFVEQEDRPAKKKPRGGSNKNKFVRIKKNVDEHRLHLFIMRSANRILAEYGEKLFNLCFYRTTEEELPKRRPKEELEKNKQKIEEYEEQYNLFLDIRNKSLRKYKELEQEAEKQQNEYWRQRESHIPYSKSFPQLVVIERKLANALEKEQRLAGTIISEAERNRIRAAAACLAIEVNPDLWQKVRDESHQYEDAHLSEKERSDKLTIAALLAGKEPPTQKRTQVYFQLSEGDRVEDTPAGSSPPSESTAPEDPVLNRF